MVCCRRLFGERRSYLLPVVTITALLIVSCADRSDVGGTSTTDMTPDTTMPMTALVIVRLTEDPQTGCVGVVGEAAESDSVPDCSQSTLRWPEGMRFLSRPPRLVDAQGKVIAGDGDVLHLSGGTGDGGVFVVSGIDKVIPSESVTPTSR